jgi:hypothetical protein
LLKSALESPKCISIDHALRWPVNQVIAVPIPGTDESLIYIDKCRWNRM